MSEELTIEFVTQRLEEIFSASLEGDELEKMISSIPKRLEKFEGRWDGLIGWAEKKYGSLDSNPPQEAEPDAEEGAEPEEEAAEEPEEEAAEEPEEEAAEEPEEEAAEEPEAESEPTAKKGGFFSKFGKKKESEPEAAEEPQAEEAEPEAEEVVAEAEEAEPEAEEVVAEAEEPEPEPQAEEAEPEAEEVVAEAEEPEAEGAEEEAAEAGSPIDAALDLIGEGNPDDGFNLLKGMMLSDPGNPEVWLGLAAYFSSIGKNGRSEACKEHASSLN